MQTIELRPLTEAEIAEASKKFSWFRKSPPLHVYRVTGSAKIAPGMLFKAVDDNILVRIATCTDEQADEDTDDDSD